MFYNKKLDSEILNIAIPIMLSNAIMNISGFLGTILIAGLGSDALSAAALIYSTVGVLVMLAFGFVIPVAILTGHLVGSNELHKTKYLFQESLLLVSIIAIVPIILMLNAEHLFLKLGQPIESAKLAGDYFSVMVYGFIPMLFNFVISQLFIGLGRARLSFYFTTLSCIINFCFTYLLIGHHHWFPTFGIAGAGCSVLITNCVLLILQAIFLMKHPTFKKLELFRWSWKFFYTRKILSIGVPIGIQRTAELLALSFTTMLMGWIGETALSVQQVVTQMSMIFLIVPFGFLQAGAILTSKAYAKKDLYLVKDYTIRVNWISTLLLIILSIIFLLMPKLIVSWFLNPTKIDSILLCIHLIQLMLFTQLFDNIRNVTTGVLRGMQDSKKPMLYSIFCIWLVAIPLAYLFAFNLHLGPYGITLGWMCGIAIGTLLTIWRFYSVWNQAKIKFEFNSAQLAVQ